MHISLILQRRNGSPITVHVYFLQITAFEKYCILIRLIISIHYPQAAIFIQLFELKEI